MPEGKLKAASDSRVAAAIREAIGAGPDEDVTVRTPQFTRPPSWAQPGCPPASREQWNDLYKMDGVALRELGLHPWCTHHEMEHEYGRNGVLYLLPGEWYRSIPAGFPITDICGGDELFSPGVTDDDIRFGCLAFGILVPAQEVES
jgi:hypothetical protein